MIKSVAGAVPRQQEPSCRGLAARGGTVGEESVGRSRPGHRAMPVTTIRDDSRVSLMPAPAACHRDPLPSAI